MTGDVLAPVRLMTVAEFHAFREPRSNKEKWELIGGEAIMMPPPAIVHQRISKNAMTMLDGAIERAGLSWTANFEIGIRSPGDEHNNPEPDVTVVDVDIEVGQVWAERFYIVVEVLSPSNRPEAISPGDTPRLLARKTPSISATTTAAVC